jgi:hypothetical protein
MAEAHATMSRTRRLAVVVGTLGLLAAAGAPTAAAGLGLPELIEASHADALGQVTETPTPSTTPVLETVQQTQLPATTPSPVSAAAEPLLQQTPPTLDPVLDIAAPALGALDETTRTATEVVSPLLQATQPVVGTRMPPAAVDAPPTKAATREEGVRLVAEEEPSVVPTTVKLPAALPAPRGSGREELAMPMRRAVEVPPQGSSSIASVPGGPENTTADLGGTEISLSLPSAPAPFAPGGPLSGLAWASASAGAGAFLLAVLAAALLLAAPGLGRRLRLILAPWPQPILQVSLERPG